MKQRKPDACLLCGTAVTQRCPAGTLLKVYSPSSWAHFRDLADFFLSPVLFFVRGRLPWDQSQLRVQDLVISSLDGTYSLLAKPPKG